MINDQRNCLNMKQSEKKTEEKSDPQAGEDAGNLFDEIMTDQKVTGNGKADRDEVREEAGKEAGEESADDASATSSATSSATPSATSSATPSVMSSVMSSAMSSATSSVSSSEFSGAVSSGSADDASSVMSSATSSVSADDASVTPAGNDPENRNGKNKAGEKKSRTAKEKKSPGRSPKKSNGSARKKEKGKRGRPASKPKKKPKEQNLFSVLSSPTRQKILKMIAEKDRHVSSLSRELDISVPVISKHLKILEDAGFVERKVFGNAHVFASKKPIIDDVFEQFAPVTHLEVRKGVSLMDAFKMVSSIEVKNVGGKNYIVSSDGEKGYFIYEVNGEFIDKRAEDYLLTEDSLVDWKRLEPMTQRRLKISVIDEYERVAHGIGDSELGRVVIKTDSDDEPDEFLEGCEDIAYRSPRFQIGPEKPGSEYGIEKRGNCFPEIYIFRKTKF